MDKETLQRLKRLTHEPPQGMYEAMHNTAFVRDREVFLRGCGQGEEDISLCHYCAQQCKERCNTDIADVPAEEFGEFMDCECPVALLYFIAAGAAEMRQKLMRYEDADEAACDQAEKHADGSCLGYARAKYDDEPCERCKVCDKNEFYEPESEAKPE